MAKALAGSMAPTSSLGAQQETNMDAAAAEIKCAWQRQGRSASRVTSAQRG